MIPLSQYGKALQPFPKTVIGRVARDIGSVADGNAVLVVEQAPELQTCSHFAAVVCCKPVTANGTTETPVVHEVPTVDHLAAGDVVAVDPSGHVRTLFRKGSRHNSILLTESCSSLCVMCSQPPRVVNEDGLLDEHLRLLELIDPDTEELGFTGGEPTLLKDDLALLIARCGELLPKTALHILSNGRLFRYESFARKIAEVKHPNLMFGIPLYSDLDHVHDHVVQCRGAFDDTLLGFLSLGLHNVPIEIRVVVHRYTFERLPSLARFVYRNLPFAGHVAIMGLEPMGYAIANLDDLWIDPWDYRHELDTAVQYLADRGMFVSVYNHQLCTVRESTWPYCKQSISDWKNEYLPACAPCSKRAVCGGFFTSGVNRKVSDHIHPIESTSTGEQAPFPR